MIMPTCQALSEAYSCIKNANCWRWKSCWWNVVPGGSGESGWDPWGRRAGSFARTPRGGDATFCRACWHCWAVPVPLALFVTVPCSVCPQSPPRSGAGRGAACPAASRRRTPAWSPRPPHPSGSRSVPPLFCRAVGPWGAATGERTLLTPTGECCLLACLEEIEVLLDIGSNRQLSDVSW